MNWTDFVCDLLFMSGALTIGFMAGYYYRKSRCGLCSTGEFI